MTKDLGIESFIKTAPFEKKQFLNINETHEK